MNVQSDDVRNVKGTSYRGENTFAELFMQRILDKGLKQLPSAFTK